MEIETLKKLGEGEGATWATFLGLFEPRIKTILGDLTDDEEKKEDAYQSVCVALVCALGKTIGTIAPVAPAEQDKS